MKRSQPSSQSQPVLPQVSQPQPVAEPTSLPVIEPSQDTLAVHEANTVKTRTQSMSEQLEVSDVIGGVNLVYSMSC